MRIVRSDDEQIVSAHGRYLYGQNNNLYYNQQNNSSCAYDADVDFSYSDKQFINELAKDRAYGTANIRPLAKDLNSFTERMYKDAVEEASRVKTMGYFNQFPELKLSNPVHNPPHSNIRNHIKNGQLKNNKGGHIANNNIKNNMDLSLHKDIKTPDKVSNIINFEGKGITPSDNKLGDSNDNFFSFGGQEQLNNGTPPNNTSPNKYDALLDQVHNNLKQEMATQIVEEDKIKLREQVKVDINNIPYKKTKEFVPTEEAKANQQSQQQPLQVRNCKKTKNKKSASKVFARICLILFMLVSLVAVYLYCTGKLNLDIITRYLNF